MEIKENNSVHEKLFKENSGFRGLVNKHQKYENRLAELGSLNYPNEKEQMEEASIKKKKLFVKDEIHSMIENYTSR